MKHIEKTDIDSLYNEYVDDMYLYACNSGFDKDHVIDAIHDIFCKIYTKPSILNNVGNVKFYLFRALRNRIIDMYRSQRDYLDISSDPVTQTYPFSLNITVEDELINTEEQRHLEQKINNILSTLPSRQKEIIYLRYLHGYSYDEISKLMNISVPACHKLMSIAINKLRSNGSWALFLFLMIFHTKPN